MLLLRDVNFVSSCIIYYVLRSTEYIISTVYFFFEERRNQSTVLHASLLAKKVFEANNRATKYSTEVLFKSCLIIRELSLMILEMIESPVKKFRHVSHIFHDGLL
jgi:hypothetical protein